MKFNMTRRTFLKSIAGGLISVTAAGTGGYYYAKEVEPFLFDITNRKVSHQLIPPGFSGLRIVQFSDTHVGFHYTLSDLKKAIKKINALEPDILIFSGDLIDDPEGFSDAEELTEILGTLDAVYGKFAVYGNHDHGGYGSDMYKEIVTRAGFELLLNEARKISLDHQEHIYIAGIDDSMLGKPDIAAAVSSIPENAYTILISHAPDLADSAAPLPIHFQISGHTHGGQVQIPFFGPLVTPPHGEKYTEGLYHIGENKMELYVNRGLGTTRLPFRFFCKPEITVYTLSG